jgi:hypothetical protein
MYPNGYMSVGYLLFLRPDPFGGNQLRVAVSPFISDVFRPPWPDREGVGRCGTPGGRQMWYEVIRTTSLHTKGQHQRRVEWAVVFWEKPCYKAGTSI